MSAPTATTTPTIVPAPVTTGHYTATAADIQAMRQNGNQLQDLFHACQFDLWMVRHHLHQVGRNPAHPDDDTPTAVTVYDLLSDEASLSRRLSEILHVIELNSEIVKDVEWGNQELQEMAGMGDWIGGVGGVEAEKESVQEEKDAEGVVAEGDMEK